MYGTDARSVSHTIVRRRGAKGKFRENQVGVDSQFKSGIVRNPLGSSHANHSRAKDVLFHCSAQLILRRERGNAISAT